MKRTTTLYYGYFVIIVGTILFLLLLLGRILSYSREGQENFGSHMDQSYNTEIGEENEAVSKDSEVIDNGTEYILQIYDQSTGQMKEYQLPVAASMLGLNRSELLSQIDEYMSDIPLHDVQQGLISYEVVSFDGNRVVLRKIYDPDSVPYQYFLIVEDDYLVVYYADRKTLFERTDIRADQLSESDSVNLTKGIYLKDQKELFGILQGYSS